MRPAEPEGFWVDWGDLLAIDVQESQEILVQYTVLTHVDSS